MTRDRKFQLRLTSQHCADLEDVRRLLGSRSRADAILALMEAARNNPEIIAIVKGKTKKTRIAPAAS